MSDALRDALDAVMAEQWSGTRAQMDALHRLCQAAAAALAQPADAPILREQPSGDAWGDGYEEGHKAGLAEAQQPEPPRGDV